MKNIATLKTIALRGLAGICLVGAMSTSLVVTAAAAENKAQNAYEAMTAEKFKKLLPGKTLLGEYRYMRERSKTYNFRETHHANGTTDYIEGPIKSKGKWYTLSTHKICYTYPDDPDMGGNISCFWVYNNDGCYYGYSRREMTLKGPRSYNDWSARWIIKGSGKSCDAAVS